MGCNYYVVRNRPTIEEPIHIGKSSAGWLFLFEKQDDVRGNIPVIWNNYSQVFQWLTDYVKNSKDFLIIDEYDRIIPYEAFINMVEKKQNDKTCQCNLDNFSNCENIGGYRFAERKFC